MFCVRYGGEKKMLGVFQELNENSKGRKSFKKLVGGKRGSWGVIFFICHGKIMEGRKEYTEKTRKKFNSLLD